MKFKGLAIGLLAACGLTSQVQGATISGTALQNVLDGITVGGSSSIDVQTDQMTRDEMWSITGAGGTIATIIIELTIYDNSNSFGIYDVSNPANFVEIMAGGAGSGDQAMVSIKSDGSVHVNFSDTGVDFTENLFGYYLDVSDTSKRYYSQTDLNADGVDHLAAFQGTNTDTVQLPGLAPGLWTNNEYVLAFEDLWGGGDRDYTDFVAMVESVTPVPEPGTLALLGLGLAGFAGIRRKRRS